MHSVKVTERGQQPLTLAMLLTLVGGTAVLVLSVVADGGFRPTVPAALVLGVAVVAAAVSSKPSRARVLVLLPILGGAVLLLWPPGTGCGLPVTGFVEHAVEDGAGAHSHDWCQLEGDRRAMGGLVLVAAGGGGVILVLKRRPVVEE